VLVVGEVATLGPVVELLDDRNGCVLRGANHVRRLDPLGVVGGGDKRVGVQRIQGLGLRVLAGVDARHDLAQLLVLLL